jgi:hypothetical protein
MVSASDSDTVSHFFCRLMLWHWGIRKQFHHSTPNLILGPEGGFPGKVFWESPQCFGYVASSWSLGRTRRRKSEE